jgi:hypothetical protein
MSISDEGSTWTFHPIVCVTCQRGPLHCRRTPPGEGEQTSTWWKKAKEAERHWTASSRPRAPPIGSPHTAHLPDAPRRDERPEHERHRRGPPALPLASPRCPRRPGPRRAPSPAAHDAHSVRRAPTPDARRDARRRARRAHALVARAFGHRSLPVRVLFRARSTAHTLTGRRA